MITQILASTFMPEAASKIAGEVDNLYIFLLWLSLISIALAMGAMTYFIFAFRRKSDNDKTAYISHNHILEFLWSFIPLVFFLVSFYWGYVVYSKLRGMPSENNSEVVNVTGRQWSWTFAYKEGIETSNELYVPKGKPVKLIMSSADVIHSFFVPVFRTKQDVLPGRYTAIWFNPTESGVFDIFCTEFCGGKGMAGHSSMIAKVTVMESADFDKWKEEKKKTAATKSLADKGKELFASRACSSCHSLDGSPLVGPSLKGVFGKQREFNAGSPVKADENYLRESILNSGAKIVKGFPAAMPVFQGQLTEEEVTALIDFIKTL